MKEQLNIKVVEWEEPGMVSVYPEGDWNLRCMEIDCNARTITRCGISIRTAYQWLCYARRELQSLRSWEPQIVAVEVYYRVIQLPFGTALVLKLNKLKPSDGWKIIKVKL